MGNVVMANRRQLLKLFGGALIGANAQLGFSSGREKKCQELQEILLPVRDMDQAISFYKNILKRPNLKIGAGCVFYLGNAILRLFVQEDLINKSFFGPFDNHFALTTQDLESVERLLSFNGVSFGYNYLKELDRWQLFFRDPSGNLVEVIEEPEPKYRSRGSGVFLRLHHVSRISNDHQQSLCFYTQQLGLNKIYRPPFQVRGHYLRGESIEVHIIQLEEWMEHCGSIMPRAIDKQDYTWSFSKSGPWPPTEKYLDPDGYHVSF